MLDYSWTLRGSGRVGVAAQLLLALSGCRSATVDLDLSDACFEYWCVPQQPRVFIAGPTGPLGVGDVVRFHAALFDSVGNTLSGRTIQWRSLASSKATVDATGLVRAVAPGDVEISATALPDGISATRPLAVVSGSDPPASVEVALVKSFLLPDESSVATATVRDAKGYALKRSATWSVGDARVATIIADGMVRGVAPGSTLIVATSEGVQGSAQLTVSFTPPEHSVRLEGIYPNAFFPGIAGIHYSVTGQVSGDVVRGRLALMFSEVYPWMKDDVGPLTCLKEVNGVIVAAMYPSVAFGQNSATYIMIKEPHGSPLVYAGGASMGEMTGSLYCDTSGLANFIGSTPASSFKPGVSRITFP